MHADGKCDIFYEDDGESEKRVAPRFVKVLLSDEEKTRATAARAAVEEVRPDPMPTGKAKFERGQRVRAMKIEWVPLVGQLPPHTQGSKGWRWGPEGGGGEGRAS